MAYLSNHWEVGECQVGAVELATTLLTLIHTDNNLCEAVKDLPLYSPTRSERDILATEHEAWNRAADAIYTHIHHD